MLSKRIRRITRKHACSNTSKHKRTTISKHKRSIISKRIKFIHKALNSSYLNLFISTFIQKGEAY